LLIRKGRQDSPTSIDHHRFGAFDRGMNPDRWEFDLSARELAERRPERQAAQSNQDQQ